MFGTDIEDESWWPRLGSAAGVAQEYEMRCVADIGNIASEMIRGLLRVVALCRTPSDLTMGAYPRIASLLHRDRARSRVSSWEVGQSPTSGQGRTAMMLHPIQADCATMLFPASPACDRSHDFHLRCRGPLHLKQEPKETPNRPEEGHVSSHDV
jgi:hypothetical protein